MSDTNNSRTTEGADNTEKQSEIRYVPVEYVSSSELEYQELDLLELVVDVWKERRIIRTSVLIFFIWGVFHLSFGPKNYESQSVLIQEARTQGSQAQQLLQRLGGINFGSTGVEQGSLPPTLYPRIVESTDFQYALLYEDIEFARFNEPINLFQFFSEYYTPSFRERTYSFLIDYTVKLPITLYRIGSNLLQNSSSETDTVQVEADNRIRILSSKERQALRQLKGRIIVTVDGNLITVVTRLPDSKATAEINVTVVEKIQEYVTKYRIEKARQNLEFTESQLVEARERYEDAQQTLAQFLDQNISLATATARTEQEHLQNQRDLTYNIYNSISQEVEQARLTLQEETPVFSTLERSNLPTSTMGGSFFLILIFLTLGVVVGVISVFVRKFVKVVISRIKVVS